MSSSSKKNPNRWVLLRHTGAPDDLNGYHFDLLLEDKDFCRTWRLSDMPLVDGPYVDSVYISPHNLYWLDIKEKIVSGNRGFATQIKKGIFLQPLPSIENSSMKLLLQWEDIERDLVINEKGCKILSKK